MLNHSELTLLKKKGHLVAIDSGQRRSRLEFSKKTGCIWQSVPFMVILGSEMTKL